MNDALINLPLTSALSVKLTSEAPALSAAQQAAADRIWTEQMTKRAGTLHNGKIFSITRVNGSQIEGHFIDYKTYLACWYQPALFTPPVYSLAVSGMIIAEDHILIGKRSAVVTNSPGAYEFVPSGGVDDSCLIADDELEPLMQLRSEFREETGLAESHIDHIDVRFLCLNQTKRLYDICCHIYLREKTNTNPPPTEYTEQIWVPLNAVENFLTTHADNIMETSLMMWKNWQENS